MSRTIDLPYLVYLAAQIDEIGLLGLPSRQATTPTGALARGFGLPVCRLEARSYPLPLVRGQVPVGVHRHRDRGMAPGELGSTWPYVPARSRAQRTYDEDRESAWPTNQRGSRPPRSPLTLTASNRRVGSFCSYQPAVTPLCPGRRPPSDVLNEKREPSGWKPLRSC